MYTQTHQVLKEISHFQMQKRSHLFAVKCTGVFRPEGFSRACIKLVGDSTVRSDTATYRRVHRIPWSLHPYKVIGVETFRVGLLFFCEKQPMVLDIHILYHLRMNTCTFYFYVETQFDEAKCKRRS